MREVFISYLREDSDRVASLAAGLRERGMNVWLDRDNIKPGQRWADAIRDELSRLQVVVEDSAEGTSWRIER